MIREGRAVPHFHTGRASDLGPLSLLHLRLVWIRASLSFVCVTPTTRNISIASVNEGGEPRHPPSILDRRAKLASELSRRA